MDAFHAMTVFVAVAEAESFAGGARRLKMSPPAVTRAVSALEERLGVRLFTRTTRVVRVTDAGARYLEDARRIIAEMAEAEAAAAGINAAPRGQLSVTAPVLFGRLYVMPVIAEYQAAFEQTSVSALFVDRVVSFLDEGMDVGIRIGQLPDSSLRAIRVGRVRRVVVGAPAYLERYGIPQTPNDLAGHRLVAASGLSPTNDWSFHRAGETVRVRVQPCITVNTNDGALAAACQGYGLTRVLSYQAAPQLASGELKTVLTDYEGDGLPVHVIHREGRNGPAKVRSFVDLAVDRLRANKALN
ncbi:LysR family transcriptional regulator [Denitromonas iodatirespirans]|uniref:LysR family transcriptional regulator n=1 Tax=Denitromonas iodatirespirans TaxID=2795389 RepID=A0A944H8T4_DENI1|nr:LysR family transcriptional regulator [Denitromonas iodatirespirans]MBT0962544.1 LysR family transcriptional regulator [Denitromonas iodatirespirans]